MGIGDPNLTDCSIQQNATVPGMAYFAYTGPIGKQCGDCAFRRYQRQRRGQFDPSTNTWGHKVYSYGGCRKFRELTGRDGPEIARDLPSCKYFEAKLK